jgi:autotransporter-associated beta strand protein
MKSITRHLDSTDIAYLRWLTLLLAIGFGPMLTHAAVVTLTTADALNTSSFTNGANWTPTGVPSSGNDYFTAALGMRTPPDANNYTFGGHSLTLQTPTTTLYSIIYKGTAANTYTIKNLTNSGGLIRSGAGSTETCTIAGNMVVVSNSTITADQSPFVIAANLSGGAILTNLNPAPQTYGTVTYNGTNSAFTGELLLGSNGILIFANTNSVPGNSSSSNPGQITLGSGSTLEDVAGVTLNNANGGITLAGNATINVSGANVATTVGVPVIGNNNGLVKTGSGTLYLNASNSYTGTTLVTNGTVAGIGSISGPMVVAPAGNLGAGNAGATVGTFTINSNLTLQGNATLRINNTGGTPVNDNVAVSGNITYGGILTITNITSDATPLTTTNTFQLFSVSGSSSTNFSSIVGSPGGDLAYTFNPTNGVLSVVLSATLNHRYSFFSEPNGSLTATDSIAAANGTLEGSATITGGKLVLNGTSGNYVKLPGGLITGDTAVTIEAWADYGALPANCY